MKNLIGVIVLLISFTSCDLLSELAKFTVSYSAQFTVDKNTVINMPIDLNSGDIITDSKKTFEDNDADLDDIDEITLDKLTVRLLSPAGGDLSFGKDIVVLIGAPGKSDLILAFKNDVPAGVGSEIDLDASQSDFAEFIKLDKFFLIARVTLDETLNEDHVLEVDADFTVKANPL